MSRYETTFTPEGKILITCLDRIPPRIVGVVQYGWQRPARIHRDRVQQELFAMYARDPVPARFWQAATRRLRGEKEITPAVKYLMKRAVLGKPLGEAPDPRQMHLCE